MEPFKDLCVQTGEFYLPRDREHMDVWPVVACDQYTAQRDKWEQADALVGSRPSALRLIIPEAYLEESDERVPRVQAEMERYLQEGVLEKAVRGMVLVERTTQSGPRLGLVMTVDLESYDFSAASTSLIRPTEGTITSRIPPRQKVRRGAALELSHVMLLCDDPGKTVVEPVWAARDTLRPLYDVALMLDGGRLRGWAVEEEDTLARIFRAVDALRQGLPAGGILLAVGDGNHSLATAKAHWMEVKETLAPAARECHPARFATVELNNIYDDALVFEPIHRVIFGVTEEEVLRLLRDASLAPAAEGGDIILVTREGRRHFRIGHPLHTLPVGTVQTLLDRAAGLTLDYVHGEEAVAGIVNREPAVGILLPPMDKALLFPAVTKNGPLPRKTFSMGEANEKRYYMEARKII